jgi:5-methylcytosine-specific restriction endonuclease McrA
VKRAELRRTAWMPRGTKPLPSVNPRQQAARKARYAKALRSPHTRALRKQVFREQQGLCVCGQEPMTVLDHLTYARLGHELRDDVQGLGPVCNARETTSKRANWMGGR